MKTIPLFLFVLSFTALTAQQTRIVKEGLPGTPANLVECYGLVFFQVHTGADWDLWKSDGTAAGTRLVKHFPTPSSVFVDFTVRNGELYFLRDHELWKTNGSAVGTVVVKSFAPDLFLWDLTLAGDRLYYRATSENGANELWSSFGVWGPNFKVADINRVISPDSPNDDPEFTPVAHHLFFWSTTPSHGTELWTTNGVAAGTRMVKDINPGPAGSRWAPGHSRIAAFQNKVYFAADDGVNGIELWKSDGTEGGTALVHNIAAGSESSFPAYMVPARIGGSDEIIFFNATDGVHGEELWRTGANGQGALMVKDIYPGANGSYPAGLAVLNGILYFSAANAANGTEIWKSSGTGNHTDLVADISPGINNSDPRDFTRLVGTFFIAKEPSSGNELWVTNGSPAGTQIVHDIRPGEASSSPQYLTPVGNKLFFSADDGIHGKTLWVYDTGARSILNFDLVNAEEDEYLQELWPGTVVNLAEHTDKLNIRANVFPEAMIGSIVFTLNGAHFSTENFAPYTLAGDNGSDYNAWTPAPGDYELCATPWSGKNGTGIQGVRECVAFTVINLGIRNYTLVNTETNEDIFDFSPSDGEVVELDLSGLAHPERVSIRVNTIPPVVPAIDIGVDVGEGGHIIEKTPPYAFFGDDNGNYRSWLKAGPYFPMGGSCEEEFTHWCFVTILDNPNGQLGMGDGIYYDDFSFRFKYDDIRVESFTLVNAVTNQDIQQLQEGDVIDLSTLPTNRLNIRANTNPPTVGSVIFNWDPDLQRGITENIAPYAFYGDNHNVMASVPGDYHIEAVPYSVAQIPPVSGYEYFPRGACGIPLSVSFKIIQSGANKTGALDEPAAPSALQVFPNPNEGSFSVSFTVEEMADVKVEVYDLLGKMVYRDEMRSFSGAYSRQLDLSIYGQGIYLLKVQEGGATHSLKKIVVTGN